MCVLAARPIASFSALFTLWPSMMAAVGLALVRLAPDSKPASFR
jgi:hypothetical protein